MKTNNFYAALKGIMQPYQKTDFTAVDYSGTTRTLYNYVFAREFYKGNLAVALFPNCIDSSGISANTTAITSSTYGLRFGNGTEEPSLDDYKLSGDIITTISILSTEYTVTYVDNGAIANYIFNVKNTGSTEITISEIGVFVPLNYETHSTKSTFLIERSLLESPVTIPVDGLASIEYKMNYTLPSAT